MNGTPPRLLPASRLKSSCTQKIPNQSIIFHENYEMRIIIACDVFIDFFIKHLTIMASNDYSFTSKKKKVMTKV